MPISQIKGTTTYTPLPFLPGTRNQMPETVNNRALDQKRTIINQQWYDIQNKCNIYKTKLDSCTTDTTNSDACSRASINLQKCTASIICPEIVTEFDKCVDNLKKHTAATNTSATTKNKSNTISSSIEEEEEKVTLVYDKMIKCIDLFKIESQEISRK